MEGRRCVAQAAAQLRLLVEVFICGQDVGPEYAKDVAVKLIGAGLTDQADDASGAALVRGGSVLGLDANFVDTILGNIHRGDDRRSVVFRNANRTSVEHVIDRSDDGAVNRGGRNIDTGAANRNVLNRLHRVAGVGRTVGRSDTST